MSASRLSDYLEQMALAAVETCGFVEGLSKDDFLADARTQKAVVMNLIILGEAASKVMDRHPKFCLRHPAVRWRDMRGMRNRIAHGYFDINLEVVWETVATALPHLSKSLPDVRNDAAKDEPGRPDLTE